MIYLVQLIYVNPGQEAVFNEFESIAIPLLPKYKGDMMLRVRPSDDAIIQSSIDKPYEIHYLHFDNEKDLKNYLTDETRQKFLHLKEQSIRTSVLIKGEKV